MPIKLIAVDRFVIEMEIGELLSGAGEGPEATHANPAPCAPSVPPLTGRDFADPNWDSDVRFDLIASPLHGPGDAGWRERNARQVAFEIEGVAFAVAGMVQQAVDVVEDVPFADGGVVVVGAELEAPNR